MIPSALSRGIAPDFASGLIPGLPRVVAPRPREISPVALTAFPASRSPYAEEFLGAASPDSSPLPWPSRSLKRSALPCSPLGANMSTLQDSLNGTGCWFAPPSQRDTPLRHPVTPVQREPAPRLSGDYRDRTCTGKLSVPFRAHQRVVRELRTGKQRRETRNLSCMQGHESLV